MVWARQKSCVALALVLILGLWSARAEANSCASIGGTKLVAKGGCGCDVACFKRGDCCPDYCETCGDCDLPAWIDAITPLPDTPRAALDRVVAVRFGLAPTLVSADVELVAETATHDVVIAGDVTVTPSRTSPAVYAATASRAT